MFAAALLAIALATFHCSEYGLTYIYNRDNLSIRSWLVSWPYCIAMGLGLVEYATERLALPWTKASPWTTVLGCAIIATGEGLRITAMVTAKHNFTHTIARQRTQQHTLITTGIYAYMRHPGYTGWALWAVGTQILLANPLCMLGFALVTWRFFARRIQQEDDLLLSFFGLPFLEYKVSVPSGIWGIP